jgi:hypothetical protein
MVFAEVTFDGDLSTCAWEGLVFLLLLGGILFALCYFVAGQNPVASSSSRPKKSGVRFDSLKVSGSTESPPQREPLAASKNGHDNGRTKDKRRALRRGGSPVPVLVSDVETQAESIQGLVLNRSKGGLCLSVSQPIEVGRLLAVRTSNFPEDLDSVQLRVRHCKQKGDSCRLGCQFMQAYPWSVILIFG